MDWDRTSTRTWMPYTFECLACRRRAYASEEAIRFDRQNNTYDDTVLDREVAAGLEYCLACAGGAPARGEHPLDPKELDLNEGAVLTIGGGNMGGDCDWDGFPVEDGKVYVAATPMPHAPWAKMMHPGAMEPVIISGPFEDGESAEAWALALGFTDATWEEGAGDEDRDVNGGDFIDWLAGARPALYRELRRAFLDHTGR